MGKGGGGVEGGGGVRDRTVPKHIGIGILQELDVVLHAAVGTVGLF